MLCGAGITWKSDKTTQQRMSRIRSVNERNLTGKARMNAYRDRVAEIERVKEGNRVLVAIGAGVVPVEPGNESRWRIEMRSHLARTRHDTTRTE